MSRRRAAFLLLWASKIEQLTTSPLWPAYLPKVFDFRTASATLSDARQDPDISSQAVFWAAFCGFVFRLPSFQQREADLRQPSLPHGIGSPRAFRHDVLRYSLCALDGPGLERLLVQVNRTLKRGQAFDEGRVQGRIVAALDGLEVLSSSAAAATPASNVASRRGSKA